MNLNEQIKGFQTEMNRNNSKSIDQKVIVYNKSKSFYVAFCNSSWNFKNFFFVIGKPIRKYNLYRIVLNKYNKYPTLQSLMNVCV